MKELLLPALNLAALLALITYFLREPLRVFVSQRHHSFREELARAREMLQKAQARHLDFSQKLLSFESEARSLRQQSVADAQEIHSRALTETRALSVRIVKDAEATAQVTFSDLRNQVYTVFVTQVLERAEKLVLGRLTGDDRVRIRKEFSRQVEGGQ